MPTNPSSLQARLDAMVREADKNVYGHAEDCRLRECGDSCSCGLVEQNIALDPLRQLDERDARIEAQNLLINANSLDGLRGLLDWALQQVKDAETARAAMKGGQP